MSEIILRLKKITKIYPMNGVVVHALRGVDMQVEKGEFVALVGPSGCGKSTLLSIAGGLMKPSGGTVLIHGQDIFSIGEKQRAELRREHIGFVFQSFNLLADLTALENVELPMLLSGVLAEERHERARRLLAQVGLSDKSDFLPDELSGGQKQRVAIARALANSPAMILADEPTGNLDSATAKEIMDLLADLNQREGTALIMVTHSPEDAARAHRTIYMRDGQRETIIFSK